jgi:purine-nucleoside phosphorylase
MKSLPEMIKEAVAEIRGKTKLQPRIGIILGTGLGKLASEIEVETSIPYTDIPHFVKSTVEGHAGKLIFGTLSGKAVVAMQGRFHFYEGYTMQEITFPVRVLKALGIDTLIVSNACGGINIQFQPGDIMIITDHINLLGTNPLIGKNYEELGQRFPDMSEPYSKKLAELAHAVAIDEKIPVKKGVYASMSGPCLETAAEYRMLKTMGADVIGMSTVPEVIVAVHAGLKVLGLSVITDECFPDNLKPVDIRKIIANANTAEPKLVRIIKRVLEKL